MEPIPHILRKKTREHIDDTTDLVMWDFKCQFRGSAIGMAMVLQSKPLQTLLLTTVAETSNHDRSCNIVNGGSTCASSKQVYSGSGGDDNFQGHKKCTRVDTIRKKNVQSAQTAAHMFNYIPCPVAHCTEGGGFGKALQASVVVCHQCLHSWCSACGISAHNHTSSKSGWSRCVVALSNAFPQTPKVYNTIIGQINKLPAIEDFEEDTLKSVILRLCRAQQGRQGTASETNLRKAAVQALLKYAPDQVLRCSICDEAFAECISAEACEAGDLRVVKEMCSHEATTCQKCWSDWILANVEQMITNIKCTQPDCHVHLYPDDIKRLATPNVFNRYTSIATGKILEQASWGSEKRFGV
eukprot:m.206617 g.206617  ORF g.206617 m.206617 type:complete len:355 (+) comp32959_c0_seq1:56-1120(+)